MKGSGIIGAYHARRVAPLMARALPLYQMVPEASFEGTVLVDEALPYSKVAQRVKEAMEPTKDSVGAVLDFMYPVLGHPPMWPEPGFVEFVSFLSPCFSFHLNFRPPDADLRIVGPPGGTVLQSQLGSAAKGPNSDGNEPCHGRLGQEDKGAHEEQGNMEVANSRSRR